MEYDPKKQRVLQTLQEVENELQKNPEMIPEHMFQMIESICSLFYRWRESQGSDGWSTKAITLPTEQQKVLEGGFRTMDGFFQKQQIGGGWFSNGGADGDKEYVKATSLDDTYYSTLDYFKKVSEQWGQVSESLGIVKPESDRPFDGALGFLSLIVEGLRIWIAFNPMDEQSYRFFLSVTQALLDAVRGNMKQAVLSTLGILDEQGYMLSILGRFIINISEMKSIEFKKEVSFDIYKTSKTVLASFLLWCFSFFAPGLVKQTIRDSITQIEELAKEDNIDISDIKTKFLKASQKANLSTEIIPGYADLQRLQEIFQKPEITCNPHFKQLMKPVGEVFTLRLAFDLVGIPTTDSEIASVCEAKLKGGASEQKRKLRIAKTIKNLINFKSKRSSKTKRKTH